MKPKYWIIFVGLLLFFISPVFASGITFIGTSLAPVFANTNASADVLNLSINVSGDNGATNISSINITVVTGTFGNISSVTIKNSTGTVLGVNTSINPATNMSYTVFLGNGFFINGTITNASLIVSINISGSATRQTNMSINVSSPAEIRTLNNDNVSLVTTQSNGVFIQDIHGNATISPRFVDTGVLNQSFLYAIVPKGGDAIKNISIILPPGFTLINITGVERGDSTNLTGDTDFTNTTTSNRINITLASSTLLKVEVFFTANINSTPVSSSAFNSTITGGNLTNVFTDPVSIEATNVTAKQLLNVSNVKIIKSTAIVNGTDYWEFNFTINYTANIPTGGLIQFKLTNWNSTTADSINITNSNCPGSICATLRNGTDFNTTSKFNVTNNYGTFTTGISVSSITENNLIDVTLRMIIPTGTIVSSNWQATYGFLFRANP